MAELRAIAIGFVDHSREVVRPGNTRYGERDSGNRKGEARSMRASPPLSSRTGRVLDHPIGIQVDHVGERT
jgi:hypothetical protein